MLPEKGSTHSGGVWVDEVNQSVTYEEPEQGVKVVPEDVPVNDQHLNWINLYLSALARD